MSNTDTMTSLKYMCHPMPSIGHDDLTDMIISQSKVVFSLIQVSKSCPFCTNISPGWTYQQQAAIGCKQQSTVPSTY